MTIRYDAGRDFGVAIIGMGGCFPDAGDVPAFWENICRGHVAIKQVPESRWEPRLYWSEDRSAPDRTYSRIGGFIDGVRFDQKRFRIPPRTLESVDDIQKLALTAVADALEDAGLEVFSGRGEGGRAFDRERTAVIMGNAMGGEFEDLTSLRVWYPSMVDALEKSGALEHFPESGKEELLKDIEARFKSRLPKVTEDSMPGELSNCITGRIANTFDLQGPNYTTDAACAASLAAVNTAVQGLRLGEYDLAISGGVDRSMDPPTYAKFSKIGALSAEHSAPFDARANGFVMGEGAGVLILKRLPDALRDGDRVYAVIRGIGTASDGRGKGMTAPNPRGQRAAIERAYDSCGVPVESVGLFEAHGTSTVVGDGTELQVLSDYIQESGVSPAKTPIGSVKSMIGHLKSAAGAAALIKTALALHHKTLPPSANFQSPTRESPLHKGFLSVIQTARPWEETAVPRRAAVSAFGFGGTNFHVILQESDGKTLPEQALPSGAPAPTTSQTSPPTATPRRGPSHGADMNRDQLLQEITQLFAETTGYDLEELDPGYELEQDLGIDTVKQAEIFGVLRERYGMVRDDAFRLADVQTLNAVVDYVAATGGASSDASAAAGDPLESPTVFVFGADSREAVLKTAQSTLNEASGFSSELVATREAAIKAPVRLAFAAADLKQAQTKATDAERRRQRALTAQGIYLDEAAPSEQKVAFLFPGQGSQYINMFQDLAGTYPVVEQTFQEADEILRPLIEGTLTETVWPSDLAPDSPEAVERLKQTEICQPAMLTADVAMMRLLQSFGVRPDFVVGHSLGEYAACVAAGVLTFADALYAVSARGREMAGVKVEDNGKMATVAADCERVAEILKTVEGYVIAANKNCSSQTVIAGNSDAVDSAVERFGELKIDARHIPVSHAFHSAIVAPAAKPLARVLGGLDIRVATRPILSNVDAEPYPESVDEVVTLLARQLESPVEFIGQVERLYQEGVRTFVEVGPRRAITGFVRNILGKRPHYAVATNHHKKPGNECLMDALAALAAAGIPVQFDRSAEIPALREEVARPVREAAPTPAGETLSVSGMSVMLPTGNPVGELNEDSFGPILAGENFIKPINSQVRKEIVDKNVLRLNKTTGEFEKLRELGEVIQLAGRLGDVDLVGDYGLDSGFVEALDTASRLAIAAGVDALRDAGLPLVRKYRKTSTGRQLPDRWALPESLAKRTGVIFASAFPGVDKLIDEVSRQTASSHAGRTAEELRALLTSLAFKMGDPEEVKRLTEHFQPTLDELDREGDLYRFNRKFLFWALSMGHAQLAQTIGAKGPNSAVNAACASGGLAIGVAADWIRLGRCDRVVVVTADDPTSATMLPWIGSGFLAAGAATVESEVKEAAVPFGAKRNGMILGAGASGFVLERESLIQERGMQGIADVVASHFSNSAFHGTRLDGGEISEVFTEFVGEVKSQTGYELGTLADKTFFMSHETYTPARGGSSQSEMDAIRSAFGEHSARVMIANTKGYTGHPMGATLEDVVSLKGLQRQVLPAVANLSEVDPAFADLLFADGSPIDREIAIRFAAGFGSQIAMVAYRRRAVEEPRLQSADRYHAWLDALCGREEAGLEIVKRTLRVAEKGGARVSELGVPSLALSAGPLTERAEALVAVSEPDTVPAQAPGLMGANLMEEIQRLFAEQTGYEPEELEPDYQLEADLGVDTVKQAEIFSLLRERYGMPTDEAFKLSEVQTIRAVAKYVAGFVDHDAAAPVPVEEEGNLPSREELLKEVVRLFAEQTGYDAEELDPSYELEADLGIDTVKQAEIFSLLRTRYGMAPDEAFKLSEVQTLHAVVDYVRSQTGGVLAATPDQAPAPQQEQGDHVSVKGGAAPERASLITELQQLFAEQTGYDVEELEPDYGLEEDLGIDTVKQAEILAVIRERFGLPQTENFKLADVQSLNALTDYVLTNASFDAPAPVPAPVNSHASMNPATSPGGFPEAGSGFTVQRVGTVYAEPSAGERRSLLGRLVLLAGGDSALRGAFREELIVREARVVEVDDALRGEALETFLKHLGERAPDDLVCLLDPTQTDTPDLIRGHVERTFELARAFVGVRGEMRGAGLLLAGSSPGAFGFFDDACSGVTLGALGGIAKSLAKEWEGAHCRAFDLDDTCDDPRQAAALALSEWLSEGPVELAWRKGARVTLQRVAAVEQPEWALEPGAAVVVTGGTRGVTFELLKQIATQGPLRVALVARTLGVTPEESPVHGKDAAQRKELAREALKGSEERVTPVALREWIEKEDRRLEVAENIATLRDLGCEVKVFPCDVGQQDALSAVAGEITRHLGEVALLLHGAGLEESKFLQDKDLAAFQRVFDPKASAALTLWFALRPERMVTMGSVAGRFGNGAQVDYAAANELMGALSRSETRNILNINWTAWGDVGMATRGSVQQVLESTGVDLLPAAMGSALGASLAASGCSGDVVVAGALGHFAAPEQESPRLYEGGEPLPWLFDAWERHGEGARYFRRLDPAQDPGLDHHRLEGTPVFPGVLGVELMAGAASHFAGEPIAELREVRFALPVKLFEDRPLEISVEVKRSGESRFETVLVSYFTKPSGKRLRREHFFAEACSGERAALLPPRVLGLELPRDPQISREDIYRRYFHGPAFQVLDAVAVLGEDGVEVSPVERRSPWLGEHGHREFETSPFLREAGFQAAGLWEMAELGRMALPAGVDRILLSSEPAPEHGLRTLVRLSEGGGADAVFDIWTCDEEGRCYDGMLGYRTETLHRLSPEERFEPTRGSGDAPRWSTLELSEVQGMLEADPAGTLRRYLSEQEIPRFEGLKTSKRRLEWLAGRVVAKRLIREERFAREGAIVPYGAITILPDDLGAPRVQVAGEASEPLLVSITHSAGVAMAFQSLKKHQRPGIDVEQIEPRDASFERDYFSEAELAQVRRASNKDALLTAFWAIKEAYLKGLGIGARIDFRELEVAEEAGRWSVTHRGEAREHALRLCAGEPTIEVEMEQDRVIARVLLPLSEAPVTGASV